MTRSDRDELLLVRVLSPDSFSFQTGHGRAGARPYRKPDSTHPKTSRYSFWRSIRTGNGATGCPGNVSTVGKSGTGAKRIEGRGESSRCERSREPPVFTRFGRIRLETALARGEGGRQSGSPPGVISLSHVSFLPLDVSSQLRSAQQPRESML